MATPKQEKEVYTISLQEREIILYILLIPTLLLPLFSTKYLTQTCSATIQPVSLKLCTRKILFKIFISYYFVFPTTTLLNLYLSAPHCDQMENKGRVISAETEAQRTKQLSSVCSLSTTEQMAQICTFSISGLSWYSAENCIRSKSNLLGISNKLLNLIKNIAYVCYECLNFCLVICLGSSK